MTEYRVGGGSVRKSGNYQPNILLTNKSMRKAGTIESMVNKIILK